MSIKHHVLVAAPGAAVLSAAAAGLLFAPHSAALLESSRTYVFVALTAALLVSWRLHCSRLFLAALVLGAVHVALQSWPPGAHPLTRVLLVTFLPPGVALLSFAADGSFTLQRIRNQSALLLGPLALAAFLCAGRSERALQLLTANLLNPAYTDWTRLSQVALSTVVISFCVLAIRALRIQRAADAGLTWAMLALTCALASSTVSPAHGVWLLAGAVVLIIALIETAYAMAFHDELTGLPSRRALARVRASMQPPYAVAIVDVDHFKSFNDEHGHDVGDQVLRMVAGRLRDVGGGGKAFRSGGEEFTIVFAGASKQEALPHVEAVRAAVESAHFTLRTLPRPRGKHADAQRGRARAAAARLQVTISVGVAASSARNTDMAAVLRAADKAMYRAKDRGRNCVVA